MSCSLPRMRYGLFRGGCGKHSSGVVYEIGLLLGCHQLVKLHDLRAINTRVIEELWRASEELIYTYFEKIGESAKSFSRRFSLSFFVVCICLPTEPYRIGNLCLC